MLSCVVGDGVGYVVGVVMCVNGVGCDVGTDIVDVGGGGDVGAGGCASHML